MEQYERPWEHRILDSTIEAICDHPEFSPGWQKWDERVFHVDRDGVMRSIAQLWPNGKAPRIMLVALSSIRLFRKRSMGRVLSLLFGKGNDQRRERRGTGSGVEVGSCLCEGLPLRWSFGHREGVRLRSRTHVDLSRYRADLFRVDRGLQAAFGLLADVDVLVGERTLAESSPKIIHCVAAGHGDDAFFLEGGARRKAS